MCVINQTTEKIITENHFQINTQKFCLAVIFYINILLKNWKYFPISGIFLIMISTLVENQCQNNFWILHYIKFYIYISKYEPSYLQKKKKLKNKNIKKKKKPNERKSEGIFAATRQFTNIFLFLFLFREKFWRKGMFSSIQELCFLMSIKYLLRVTLT